MTFNESWSRAPEMEFNRPENKEDSMSDRIPESELTITAARASGPGGQKVNKTNSKAVLHWSVGDSMAFTDEQKELIRADFAANLNSEDQIVMSERQSRSWHENREEVIRRLQKRVNKALVPKKQRKKTKEPKQSVEQRLRLKREQSEKKALRKPPQEE